MEKNKKRGKFEFKLHQNHFDTHIQYCHAGQKVTLLLTASTVNKIGVLTKSVDRFVKYPTIHTVL